MKKNRNLIIGSVFLAAFVPALLTGCGRQEEVPWEPSGPAAVSVGPDGTIIEYLSDPLDADRYQFLELKQMLEEEITAYSQENGPGRIHVDAASEEEGGAVRLVLSYQSWEDYAGFHQVSFYSGTMLGAQMEGYSFEDSFVRVKNGKLTGGEYPADVVLNRMDDRVVIVEEPVEIHVEGTIDYVSSGCRVLSADTAAADTAAADTAENTAAAGPAAEAGRRKLVYVIYDD